jgi:two-component system sensor histidine kinase CpxA
MHGLFFKIFIWFWLAMASVGAALVVTVALTESEPVVARWREAAGNSLALFAYSAAEAYEQGGQSKLTDYLTRLEQTTHISAFLIEERGREVAGQAVPDNALSLAAIAQSSDRAQFSFERLTTWAARSTVSPSGARYVLVAEMPRGRFGALRREPGTVALRLVAVAIVAGLVCYGLARYITLPVLRLSEATRRVAAGDLAARVGSKSSRRRDELASLGRDFDRMAERIESLMLAHRRLLGDISHELRSPLARLNVALGLARQQAGAEAAAPLDRIEREAERMNELIGQLMTLSRLETELQGQPFARLDLSPLVSQVAADADFEARSRSRSVRIVSNQTCIVTGAEALLRSAIENVIRNAVKYTAENTEVQVSLERRVDGGLTRAIICVLDRGPGVPDECIGDLFRPFYRVAAARDRSTGGAGLGLAIAERAVRLHGGTVQASNAPGAGLLVQISLPISE